MNGYLRAKELQSKLNTLIEEYGNVPILVETGDWEDWCITGIVYKEYQQVFDCDEHSDGCYDEETDDYYNHPALQIQVT